MSRGQYEAKVDYRVSHGFRSTAYLDERDGNTAWGTDKYTGLPITVEWDGNGWIEVESHS